ncbi:MAG: DUF362 domain-containing protein [Candidatus Latescibacteria bacterium]|nr:DUF362 domain-containing protein [Candidatus Latescibacterota bacterium]
MPALILLALLLTLPTLARAEGPTVAVVASDMLPAPVSPDSVLSDAAIDELVRQAMELGGIRQVLKPDAKHVLLKPCIVVAERDSWRNVNPRAVRAVALVVHALAPKARITVGEGPGAWMKDARPEVKHWELNIADGFETEGYRAALADPRLRDAQIEFVDLNFSEPRLVQVPGGGWARDEYWIAAPVLDADVAITIPRLKTHMPEHGGITVAMKNQMGVAPGMKYGWPKKTGYPSGSGNPGIPHSPEILGEMITDLNLCARVDFAVAESFRRTIDQGDEGRPDWINGVVAGADLVAVDAVSAYLMGFNPEEVETVVNGDRRGLGVGRLEAITVAGDQDLDRIRRGFPFRGQMGMANRTWLVSGPYPHTEAGQASVDPAAPVAPGQQGFGEPVWFQDDKCDLGQLLGKPTDCTAFAYCEVTSPAGGPAKLQVASDEGMTVWLNGAQVYRFEGWRRLERPNDLVPVVLQPGTNRLLCRLEQTSRQFQFSLNVVDPEPSPVAHRYQRPRGLRFSVPGEKARQEIGARDIDYHDSWRQQGWWREVLVDQTRPDSLSLEGAVPALLQTRSLGVVRSRCFGDQVRARALVRGNTLTLSAAGAAELWADLGALRGKGQPVEVKAVELVLRWEGKMVEAVRDSELVWSGAVPDPSILVLSRPDTTSSWSARWEASPPPAESAETLVGQTTGPLGSGVFTLGLTQSTTGVFLADAYRELSGADLGISLAWEAGETLPAGPLARGSLLDLIRSEDARLASWTMSGAQVDSLLEAWVSPGDARDTPQLSGFTGQYDPSRAKGDRLTLSLEPGRQYRLATLNWYTDDKWPGWALYPVTPIQAAEAYLAKHNPYTPVTEARLVTKGE